MISMSQTAQASLLVLVGHLLLVIVDASDDNVTIDMTGLGKAYLEVTPHIDSSQYTPSIDPVCVQVGIVFTLSIVGSVAFMYQIQWKFSRFPRSYRL